VQGLPKCYLVCCQHRTREVFFQRLDDSDGTEAITADENSLGALGRMGADPRQRAAGLRYQMSGVS